MGKQTERILDFEAAQQLVVAHAESLTKRETQCESVPLLASLGRTLAEEITADRDFPPFPRATRDGYALRSEDLQRLPSHLQVIGEIRAGGEFPSGFAKLEAGQALAIMTGAPVPSGADAVVMVEHTEREDRAIRVLKSVTAGENIVPRGSEGKAGAAVLERGTVLSYTHIAVAAAVGRSQLCVYSRPKIAILPTGDEVVPIDRKPSDYQIRNSNSFSLAAQVIAARGEPVQLPIAPDKPEELRELIRRGLESDLLLLSGGVSAGEYDLVEDALAEFSAEFFFTGVQIQPGKPLVFGRAHLPELPQRSTYFFGLPGNPISTMVTFELFARIMIRALTGAAPAPIRSSQARLANAVRVKTGLTRFLPARLSGSWNSAEVTTVKWQGSGDIAAFAKADCLLVIPPDREQFEPGDMMTVWRL